MLLIPRTARLEQSLWEFSCEFLFFMFMLRKGPERKLRKNVSQLLLEFVVICATVAAKLVICVAAHDILFPCIVHGPEAQERQLRMDTNFLTLLYYNTIWLPTIVGGMWVYDLFEVVIPLITLDSYRYGPFNNWVGLSSSITELWGKRYNLLISEMLKNSVFLPMKRLLNVSNTIAGLSSFAMSGILHMYVIIATFGVGYEVRTLSFFLIHGIACSVDAYFHSKRPRGSSLLPLPLSIFITLAFVAITTPLYTRPLIYPSMIGDSPWSKMVPPTLEPYIPRLAQFVDVRAACLG
eukprot:CAMPEP_0206192072 /NCGR_PEP_ID=MMETSP0166-20121206/5735_1 /ASSEMBLY_ACC=CAM_ASM_000260 /TAXON_ID=95228 /ORGANISM="Vannella robusta, Strain DIVA3 518/3/11/1/6" /LENGTH=293 /DNA_ID=CAMNT_0053608487 /DNA_START=1023 /DNA_END=1904 /DNA_ORIENTATION=+